MNVLSELEKMAVDQAIPRWIAGLKSASTAEGTHRQSQAPKFQGETADDVLARFGITFERSPGRYCRVETEVRQRARKLLASQPVLP